jgi:hypothetical protein
LSELSDRKPDKYIIIIQQKVKFENIELKKEREIDV